MELLELPIQNEKSLHIRAVRGLRLSGIAETVDLIDIDDCKPSESGLRFVIIVLPLYYSSIGGNK